MAIQKYANLSINSTVIKYEAELDVQDGSITRNYNPQINGSAQITSDISTNKSTISIQVRQSNVSDSDFDDFYDKGDANLIFIDDKSYSRATMKEKPSRQNMQLVTYVFECDPPA